MIHAPSKVACSLAKLSLLDISSIQLLNRVRLFVTPWTAAHQASLSITNSQSLLKLMSIESVMPSKHLTLSRPLLLLPSIFPYILGEIVFLGVCACSVVSDSLQSHGLQPARLLCSWDFPGKNTEVGCYSLLQGIFLTQ